MKVKIGNCWVGEGEACFIIAEVGANHDGKLSQGKQLIEVAAEAKVDAIKFQSFTVENWISKELESFPGMDSVGDLREQVKRYELPYGMFKELKDYAESVGLICFSSPSHVTDVDRLEELKVDAYKFGSVQITDIPTIIHAAKKGKPMLISTGGSTLSEIADAVESIYSVGNRDIILFQCTVLYPANMNQVNLRAMEVLKETFNLPVGYSDHTIDAVTVPVAAVARGAVSIEKHFTLSRKLKGPDHPFALEPEELKAMVKAIRSVEEALGEASKQPLEEESELVRVGRRSIVAKVDITKGEIIREEMITTKRPGYGIEPKHIPLVINRTAKRDIKEDELIKWEDV